MRVRSSRYAYEGRAVKLRVDSVELASGRKTTREVVERADAVAIVALDDQDCALLVRQYRQPVGRELLEVPAGVIEPGEEPADCARRELREETGYAAAQLEGLGGFYSTPGFCTEYLHLFLATDLHFAPLQAEDSADISLVRVPLGQIPELIASGQLCDAKSIAGLLRVVQERPKG